MTPKYNRVYLSARHLRAPELINAKTRLEAQGIEITARWLDEIGAGAKLDPLHIALMSKEDIERADAYVLLGDERGDSGHRHVECGIAIGLNKPIIIVARGWENIWQRLPTVTVVQDWAGAEKVLLG